MDYFYKLLEIDETATDAEVKKAYILMKNRYDPINYEKEELRRHAEKKTKEIITAFDTIMNERRARRLEKGEPIADSDSTEDADLDHINDLINAEKLDEAESALNSIGKEKRVAQWYYLKGLVCLKKGWLENTINFFAAAARMEPENSTYREALNNAMWQSRGNFGKPEDGEEGRPFSMQPTGCGVCDICMGMLCVDCCCECTAGSFRCC